VKALRLFIDVIRGALIGVAEIIPGVSGGTIALIVGVYGTLIGSAGHLVRGVVRGVSDGVRGRGFVAAKHHFGQVDLRVLVPVALGMVAAVLVAARLLAPLIEAHPEETRALFAGLIVVSLIVPIRMVGGRWSAREVLAAVAAAILTFGLTSIPSAPTADPNLVVVVIAAAVAICALVLPGVSGSFLLLTVGLYAPTLDAVNDRDLAYIGAFAFGAVVGLSLFVSGLEWLLEHKHRITLAVMTGLMVGSLRSLWPWQGEAGSLLAPGDNVGLMVMMFAIGMVIVAVLIVAESVLVRRRIADGEDVLETARPTA
jgi:putative membrane protein